MNFHLQSAVLPDTPANDNFFKVAGTSSPDSLTHDTLTDEVKKDFRDKAKHRAVITEVMWGLNLTPGAAADPTLGIQNQAQWVEVYNNGAALVDNDNVTLEFFPNKTQVSHR